MDLGIPLLAKFEVAAFIYYGNKRKFSFKKLILEIRSVEHGICPIAEFTSPLLIRAAILAIRP